MAGDSVGRDRILAFSGALWGLLRLLLNLLASKIYILLNVLLLLLKLLLQLLGVKGLGLVLGRLVSGDGRHITGTEVGERARVRAPPVPRSTDTRQGPLITLLWEDPVTLPPVTGLDLFNTEAQSANYPAIFSHGFSRSPPSSPLCRL